MNKAKKEKLAQAGWVETTVEDFLELTPDESAYIEFKLSLSHRLKTVRKENNLTQRELAVRLQSSQSRIAKMEGADPTVSVDLLLKSLFRLNETPKDIGKALMTVDVA